MNSRTQDLASYCDRLARQARDAAIRLAQATTQQKNDWLRSSAESIRAHRSDLLAANARDLTAGRSQALTAAQLDRLELTAERLESVAAGLEALVALPDPVGQVLSSRARPNGLRIDKVRVPLGVVLFIYESRPNVTVDAAGICVKSGNAVILRGGKEAASTSQQFARLLRETAPRHGLPATAVQLVETSDREAVGRFLRMSEWIDLAIPRGGEGLIRRVVEEARMPVIKHYAGNCHVYIDEHADPALAEAIVINSKCHRYGVCNAAESLLVHTAVAERLLPRLAAQLLQHQVEIRGDAATCRLVPQAVPLKADDLTAEYLAPVISVCIVPHAAAAIEHINRYGSHHTDAIISEDAATQRAFAAQVDSAAVMINASTRFHDGGEFGLGAEIGISTDKLHARGPCGLEELTSYKYVVYGQGQVRA